ncbi:MAG: Lrp/AsnC family transcriptional regulator [Hyphomonas sp.]
MPNFITSIQQDLDLFDRAILNLVQRNNQLSHAAIGEQVGLSASAVRRRLGTLRTRGVIMGDVSLLDASTAGETLLVTISFAEESPEIYAAFERQMMGCGEVRQCYHIAGQSDYFLVVSAPSLRHYEEWSIRELMSNPAIRRYDTTVVWSCKKFETAIPL